jgi:nicotinate-nucleotide pyrophosphorylase (carboxylating)
MIPETLIVKDARSWLEEDIPAWDLSLGVIEADQSSTKAYIFAKQKGTVGGINVAAVVFNQTGVRTQPLVQDGDEVGYSAKVMGLEGLPTQILMAERTALNILGHMSGITTYTKSLVVQVSDMGFDGRIAATRKTLPGLRKYQKWAVHIGGGDTHRMNLSDMVLLKENHIAIFGGVKNAIDKVRKGLSFSKKIEIEVRTDEEAIEAVNANVDVILLDNYSPDMIGNVITRLREINPNVILEASGNIHKGNIKEYAKTGVDIISLGKLTHSVQALDFSLLFEDVLKIV